MLTRYSTNKNGKLVKKAIIYARTDVSIPLENIDPDAFKVIKKLRDVGFSAYLVGGAVRDLLLEKKPKDFDIVTDATPSRIKKIFRNSRIIGKRFRLVHIFFEEKIFEVSTFRSLANGSIGNSFGTMDEDVQRRDFTVNALYFDPLKEQIIDYVNGMQDIKKKIINPVIPLKTIFTEDPVRMIRAVKYSVAIGCTIPFLLARKIKKNSFLLASVSSSRLTEELIKILNSDVAHNIILKAHKLTIFMYLQPAASILIDSDKVFAEKYYGSLQKLSQINAAPKEPRLGERLYFILFDFICSLADWENEVAQSNTTEIYHTVWQQCRNFILPMNPPRIELDFAIRKALFNLGIKVKLQKQKRRTQKKIPHQTTESVI